MATYYPPFQKPAEITEATQKNIIQQAQRPTVKSIDGQNLHVTPNSANLGFLELVLTLSDFDDVDEVAEILTRSEVTNIRGTRGVIVGKELPSDDATYKYQIFVGRNVWYNKHRVTAGWPATDDEVQALINDFKYRVRYKDYYAHVEVADTYDHKVDRDTKSHDIKPSAPALSENQAKFVKEITGLADGLTDDQITVVLGVARSLVKKTVEASGLGKAELEDQDVKFDYFGR